MPRPDEGPVPAQLILHLPAAVIADLGGGLPALLQRLAPSCLIAGSVDGRLDRALAAAAHADGVPVLLELAEDAPHRVGADGVYLTDPALAAVEVAGWREALGPDGMVVAFCGASRHAAMEAAEAGADAVAFGGTDLAGLIGWWAPLMEVPCIAAGVARPEEVAALAAAGADFILPDAALWDGGAAAVEAIAAALAEHS
ncbi:thiamine phosphate synthase [Marinibaculum pumilum]|uniref:Thiamine phosphate synthase n=1 Tax=Marinibaculum pumilum TaxID=1766165 RepID=A0ABV7L7P7_9PROT